MEKEMRILTNPVEIRSDEGETPVITGYALKFERWSKPMYGFKEKLARNCLDNADMTDTVALVNHDYNLVLGRVGVNVTLTIDEIGLRFDITPIDTSYAKDLLANMRAGVINKCSFGFTIDKDGQEWRKGDELDERTITKIKKLYDVSIVTDPAYDDTEAVTNMRSYEEFKNNNRNREIELLDLEMEILK
nr:MAG TPA: prohead serine protease [Caudoviricetes sp.]